MSVRTWALENSHCLPPPEHKLSEFLALIYVLSHLYGLLSLECPSVLHFASLTPTHRLIKTEISLYHLSEALRRQAYCKCRTHYITVVYTI